MSIAVPAAGATPAPVEPLPPPLSRVRARGLTDNDRNYSIAMHLTPLAGFAFLPLMFTPIILWVIRKDESAFNDDHGREMTNALISFVLYHLAAFVTVIGLIALPVLYVLAIINMIRGAVAAGKGEFFRYPLTIRFIS
ncbi:MAG: DUF4870 domain-containing protein [Planctomycetota bacterium]|jgi:uncharacterized Tic20 family protein